MKWIKGPQYDYPEGCPRYFQTLWWDLDAERELGNHEIIPKELRRRRWVPGQTTFISRSHWKLGNSSESTSVIIDLAKGDHMPMRTIKWIIRNDKLLKNLKKRDAKNF